MYFCFSVVVSTSAPADPVAPCAPAAPCGPVAPVALVGPGFLAIIVSTSVLSKCSQKYQIRYLRDIQQSALLDGLSR